MALTPEQQAQLQSMVDSAKGAANSPSAFATPTAPPNQVPEQIITAPPPGQVSFPAQTIIGSRPPPAATFAPPAQTENISSPVNPADNTTLPTYNDLYPNKGATAGSITASPGQATAETLSNLQAQKNIQSGIGNEMQSAGQQQADIEAKAAAEKNQQAVDYQTALKGWSDQHNAEHAQTQKAYEDFRAKAGTLKDPSSQFWEDKGTGARVLSGLAAFASGLGGGAAGVNGYLSHLNNLIDKNFEAHKANISGLYNSQVEAGKIEDTSHNWNLFEQTARLKGYELASMHIQHDLQAVKDKSTGTLQKLMAGQAITGLQQQEIDRKAQLAQQIAATQAAAQAADRADYSEVRNKYQDLVEKLGPQQAVQTLGDMFESSKSPGHQNAFRDIVQANGGIPVEQVHKLLDAGATPEQVNQKFGKQVVDEKGQPVGVRGRFIYPEQQAATEEGGVPTTGPTGKPLTQEELTQEKAKAVEWIDPDTGQKVVRVANSPADASWVKTALQTNVAVNNYTNALKDHLDQNGHLVPGFITKFGNGTLSADEEAKWNTLATLAEDFTDHLKETEKTTSGSGRGFANAAINAIGDLTSVAGTDLFPKPGAINKLKQGIPWVPMEEGMRARISSLDDLTHQTGKEIFGRLQSPTQPVKPQGRETEAIQTEKDLTAPPGASKGKGSKGSKGKK